MPTVAQAFAAVIVCQMLSTLLRDIVLFRYDETTREIYILAGVSIQVTIPADGQQRSVITSQVLLGVNICCRQSTVLYQDLTRYAGITSGQWSFIDE